MILVRSVVLTPTVGSLIIEGPPDDNEDSADCNCAISPTGSPADANELSPFRLFVIDPILLDIPFIAEIPVIAAA